MRSSGVQPDAIAEIHRSLVRFGFRAKEEAKDAERVMRQP